MPDLQLGGDEEADPRRVPLTPDCSDVGGVAALDIVVVLEHEVPSVEAVLAPVGDHVAVDPHPVLAWRSQQKAATAAVDARDLGGGLEHGNSMAVLDRP